MNEIDAKKIQENLKNLEIKNGEIKIFSAYPEIKGVVGIMDRKYIFVFYHSLSTVKFAISKSEEEPLPENTWTKMLFLSDEEKMQDNEWQYLSRYFIGKYTNQVLKKEVEDAPKEEV